eukprot:m.86325 g.86325  ORF g.86325 m.86325 type:complete len:197 (-) comp14767_c0_seq25:2902-3492(-)
MAGCASRGGFTAIFSLLAIAACVVALLPSIKWAQFKAEIGGEKGTLDVSLWEACTPEGCTKIGRSVDYWKNTTNLKTAAGAERDGAIAGLVLGGLFALVALIPVCCRSKCGTMVLEFLSLACIAATLFCLVSYKTNSLDKSLDPLSDLADKKYKYSYTTGYYIIAAGAGASLFSLLTSFCIKKNSDYEDLDGYTFA